MTTDTVRKGAPRLGRCTVKGCRTVARLIPDRAEMQVRGYRGVLEARMVDVFTVPGLRAHPDGHGGFLVPDVHGWTLTEQVVRADEALIRFDRVAPMCVEHKRHLRWERVDGRVVDDVKCDSRCTNARRASCDCSCGGANHGSAHG